jgi:hypothetical protein
MGFSVGAGQERKVCAELGPAREDLGQLPSKAAELRRASLSVRYRYGAVAA